jgi:hypothetical protein
LLKAHCVLVGALSNENVLEDALMPALWRNALDICQGPEVNVYPQLIAVAGAAW